MTQPLSFIVSKDLLTKLIVKLAAHLRSRPNCCICLIGELGTGKTFLTQKLIKALVKTPVEVSSPSYNLLNVYEADFKKDLTKISKAAKDPIAPAQALTQTGPLNTIWHYDLYRLNSEEEAQHLDLDLALSARLCIIEWANRLQTLYPKQALTITLDFCQPQDVKNALLAKTCTECRKITLSSTYPWLTVNQLERLHEFI